MRTRTVRRRRLPIKIVAGLALIAAACGTSQADTTGVASLADDENTAAESQSNEPAEAEAPEDPEEAFTAYEECMESEGIDFGGSIASYSGVEGLEVGSDATGVIIGGPAAADDPQRQSLDLDDFDLDAFQDAERKCSPLLANVDAGYELDPEERAEFDDAQLVFTDCMEDQGVEVPDFSGGAVIGAIGVEGDGIDFHAPDPQGDAGFISPDFDFEAFEAAASECRHAFDGLNGSYSAAGPGQ